MNLEQLRKRLKEILARCEAILEEAKKNEGENLTEDQATEFDALNAEHDQIKANIDRLEKLATMKTDINSGPGRVTDPHKPKKTPGYEVSEPSNPDAETTGGFEDMCDFAMAVKSACDPAGPVIDDRLGGLRTAAPANFHQNVGTTMGYHVPAHFRKQIWDLVFTDQNLVSLTDTEPTQSNQVDFLRDETTPWGASGIKAYWRSEGNQMTATKFSEDATSIKLNELYALVLATEELLSDAPRLNARLTTKSAGAIAWKIGKAIVDGTGVGQPLGWMNPGYGGRVTIVRNTSGDIKATDIAGMYPRLYGNYSRALWLINREVMPKLITMTLNDKLIWTPPATGLSKAPGGFLLGAPIRFNEHCEALGTEGDIQLVDPMGYYSPQRAGIKFDQSMHLYFDYNMMAFRWIFRFGGMPYLSTSIEPNKGNATMSHFVTLSTK